MKLSLPIACSLAISFSCGIQSSFEISASGFSGVKGSGAVTEETRDGSSNASMNARFLQAHTPGASDIHCRSLPEKLTSKDRGAGSIGPEGT